MCNVDKSRVSQWLTAGQISGAAIVGEGRSAKIDVELACAQLRERLSITERFGLNGLNTKLADVPVRRPDPVLPNVVEDVVRPNLPAPQVRESEDAETVDFRIKAEKVKQNEILSSRLEMEDRARHGVYIEAAEAAGEMKSYEFSPGFLPLGEKSAAAFGASAKCRRVFIGDSSIPMAFSDSLRAPSSRAA